MPSSFSERYTKFQNNHEIAAKLICSSHRRFEIALKVNRSKKGRALCLSSG